MWQNIYIDDKSELWTLFYDEIDVVQRWTKGRNPLQEREKEIWIFLKKNRNLLKKPQILRKKLEVFQKKTEVLLKKHEFF